MAKEPVLKTGARKRLWVRVPPPPLYLITTYEKRGLNGPSLFCPATPQLRHKRAEHRPPAMQSLSHDTAVKRYPWRFCGDGGGGTRTHKRLRAPVFKTGSLAIRTPLQALEKMVEGGPGINAEVPPSPTFRPFWPIPGE